MPSLELPPALTPFVVAWVAVVGACVGSFLNVVIARVPHGDSVVSPGSRCPRCRAAIRWYDNVPVVSWVLLRARCRNCGAPISFRYPLVELLGVAAALGAWARHGLSLVAVAELVLVALLLALAAIDLDTWMLPYELTVPLITVGQGASAFGLTFAPSPQSSALGAGIGWLSFAAVAFVAARLTKKEALGGGDVWLLSGIGAWLGVSALLPVVLLASTQGAVFGIVQLALGRGQPGPAPDGAPEPARGTGDDPEAAWVPPRNSVPFGPFLAAAALEWLYLAGPLAGALPILQPFL